MDTSKNFYRITISNGGSSIQHLSDDEVKLITRILDACETQFCKSTIEKVKQYWVVYNNKTTNRIDVSGKLLSDIDLSSVFNDNNPDYELFDTIEKAEAYASMLKLKQFIH